MKQAERFGEITGGTYHDSVVRSGGTGRSEALEQFHEELLFLWDGLVGQPDDALTPDARALRDRLVADVLSDEAA